jgi:hypothetical protein
MLERLEETDWAALDDAYGPAVKAPARIRALASSDKAKRDKALDELCYTIYHQGTIYAASVEAVPFLLEIVASSEVADRTPALQILQLISIGTSYHEVHASLFLNRERSKTAEWQEHVREEKSWVARIHEALKAAVPVVTVVLQRGSVEERLAAVSLLATLQDNPAVVDALRATALDANPNLGAAAISALGGQNDAPVQLIEECFERSTSELVRTVAAMHMLSHRGPDASGRAVEYLLNHLRTPQVEVRKVYEALPNVGLFLGDLGKALACAPRAAAESAFSFLYEQVKRSPCPLNDSETFGVLMLAVMLNPPPNRDWSKVMLTKEQRMAIRLVADRAWRIEGGRTTTYVNLVHLLESVGLPGKRDEIFALLAGTPEGAQNPEEEAKWLPQSKGRPWWKLF